MFVSASCQDPIQLDLPTEAPRLVVEGIIERKVGEPDSAFQRIKLTKSIAFLAGVRPPLVRNAQVSVIRSDGVETPFVFSERDSAYITTSLVVQENFGYRLRILYDGEVYETGLDSARRGGKIDSIYQKPRRNNVFAPTRGLTVAVDFTDPAEVRNFYFIKLFKNGRDTQEITPGNQFSSIRSDEFFNGQTLRGLEPPGNILFQPGDTALVKVISIGESLFEYLRALFIQTQGGGGGTFNPPPAPIRSNVLNRTNPERYPLGYFGVGWTSQRKLIIRPQPQ
ncbi:MAG: DUF4249 domain-containing protein [Chloroherpetonaceae bacterium]|nr:DUF4249 domain-containing protein [Chloroherpetonaceae bacterium]MCS7210296.1 DUF4249 domain-containing protein [Chloroherpetonaceae bacterium]MDW8019787.1 DUF4249 domain-containing protein [Chloroherpetonaceae bacterium]